MLRNHDWREFRHPFLLECLLRPLLRGASATEIPVFWSGRKEGESHNPFWRNFQYFRIAFRLAWEEGADVIIAIDDDNWMLNHDFVRLHGVVGQCPELPAIETSSGWFNVCSVLEEARGTPFYRRGYPRGERWKESEAFRCVAPIRRRVAVNDWLDDPDIDAMTRLERPIVV